MATYIGVVAELRESGLVEGAGKAVHHVAVDVVGLVGHGAHAALGCGERAALLVLDNVLAGNHLAARLGGVQRSRLVALDHRRRTEDSGQNGQKQGQTHLEEF